MTYVCNVRDRVRVAKISHFLEPHIICTSIFIYPPLAHYQEDVLRDCTVACYYKMYIYSKIDTLELYISYKKTPVDYHLHNLRVNTMKRYRTAIHANINARFRLRGSFLSEFLFLHNTYYDKSEGYSKICS